MGAWGRESLRFFGFFWVFRFLFRDSVDFEQNIIF